MKNYERRFTVEYLELCMRIMNLEEYIERRKLGQDEGKCGIDLLTVQLDAMNKYKMVLEMRANLEGIDLQAPEW